MKYLFLLALLVSPFASAQEAPKTIDGFLTITYGCSQYEGGEAIHEGAVSDSIKYLTKKWGDEDKATTAVTMVLVRLATNGTLENIDAFFNKKGLTDDNDKAAMCVILVQSEIQKFNK